MNLLEEIKALRDEMLSVNWPAQRLSDIITRYEVENPPVIAKDDDRGPLDLTRLIDEKNREIADLKTKLCQCDA
tara:strand:- start:802 stop:1023 length:222 start_codon:yes stop_codon:yes gene_type:complete